MPATIATANSVPTIPIGWMVAATPTISRPLKMLLPRTVPRLISSCPRRRATTTVASSGTEVATATSSAPTVNGSSPTARRCRGRPGR